MNDEELQKTIEEIFSELEQVQEELRWLSTHPEVYQDFRQEYSRFVGQARDYLGVLVRRLSELRGKGINGSPTSPPTPAE